MTYLPELRESLVRAAARQQPVAHATQPKRQWISATAIVLAVASTVAVVIIALGALHRGSATHPQATAATTQTQARAAADRLLSQVVLPHGAVKTHLHRGLPADLWKSFDQLQTPHRVDVYGIWLVPGGVQRVMDFMSNHRPGGSQATIGSEAAAGSASASSSTGGSPAKTTEIVTESTQAFNYPVEPKTMIWRELVVQVRSMPHLGTVVRVAALAGWFDPRPASTQIPGGVDRVAATVTGSNMRPRTRATTSTAMIAPLVAALNSVPIQSAGAATKCAVKPALHGLTVAYRLYAHGTASPAAVATWNLSCSAIQLTIGNRVHVLLVQPSPEIIERALLFPIVSVRQSGGSATSAAAGQASVRPTTRSAPCRQRQTTSAAKRPRCR